MTKVASMSKDETMFLSNLKKSLKSFFRQVQGGQFSPMREEEGKQIFLEVSEQYFRSWPPDLLGSSPVK